MSRELRFSAAAWAGFFGLVAAGSLAVLGAVLPWASGPLDISVSGVEGDGAITLVLGVVVVSTALMWFVRKTSAWQWSVLITAAIASVAILFTAVHDHRNVDSKSDTNAFIRVGAGLYITEIAGGLGIGACLAGALGTAEEIMLVEYDDDDDDEDDDDEDDEDSGEPMRSPAERLRELQALHAEGLITQEQLDEGQRRVLEDV